MLGVKTLKLVKKINSVLSTYTVGSAITKRYRYMEMERYQPNEKMKTKLRICVCVFCLYLCMVFFVTFYDDRKNNYLAKTNIVDMIAQNLILKLVPELGFLKF